MNPRNVTTAINPDKCIGCGACIRVCPSDTITLEGRTARVTGEKSLSCGHCMAVCPSGAVEVGAIDPGMTRFSSFELTPDWVPFGKYDPASLAGLMASRRSCRNFKEKAVPADLLEDLIKFGALAPSGTNSQEWTFTVFPDPDSVRTFGLRIKAFFEGLNKKAANPFLRKGLALAGYKDLENYYEEYFESVRDAMAEMEATGKDRLFHGASALILIGAGPDASCPKEDALLAAGNMILGAHAMGLGTCLVGFATAAMKADQSIGKAIGLGAKEKVHAAVALGYPDETYLYISGRKKPVIRYS